MKIPTSGTEFGLKICNMLNIDPNITESVTIEVRPYEAIKIVIVVYASEEVSETLQEEINSYISKGDVRVDIEKL